MDVSSGRITRRNIGVSGRVAAEEREREALFYILSALWGFTAGFAQLPFSAFPFGLAALAASSRYALGVAAGVLASSAVLPDSYGLLLAYGVAIVCRAVFSLSTVSGGSISERMFCEHISLRMISAAAGALALGLYRLVGAGFLYYDVIGMLLAMSVSSAFALLWYMAVPSRRGESAAKGGAWQTAAVCSMASLAVYAFSGITVLGIAPSVFFALILTLFATRHKGIFYGVLMAMCTGVFVSVTYAPLFILAAVSFALLCRVSVSAACFSALAVGMAWGIYMTGISALTVLFPGLFAASVMFSVLDKLFFVSEASDVKNEQSSEGVRNTETVGQFAEADEAFARLDETSQRMKRLCIALSSVSESIVYTEEKFQARTDSRDNRVSGGSLSARISGDEVAVRKRASKRRAARNDERIVSFDEISPVPHGVCAKAFASELSMISDYIAVSMLNMQSEYSADEALSELLSGAFDKAFGSRLGLRVGVFGNDARKVCVSASQERILRANKDKILNVASDTLGACFECGEVTELGKRYYLSLSPKTFLSASAAGRRRNAPAEKDFCGDSFDILSGENGNKYAFISDGMGSGKAAAHISELSSVFLRELLPSGALARDVIKMLNGFLRLCNFASAAECTSTADIADIDLYRSRVRFYKSGAAPTFVFRDGEIKRFAARTMPIGIIDQTDVAVSECEILAGDVIVMMSDGVTEGREDCPELFEFIRSRILTHSADQLADAIIGYTQKRGTQDDVSVIVIKIEQNEFAKQ